MAKSDEQVIQEFDEAVNRAANALADTASTSIAVRSPVIRGACAPVSGSTSILASWAAKAAATVSAGTRTSRWRAPPSDFFVVISRSMVTR